MSMQFILGRSGAGKTTLCIKQIVEALLDKKSDKNLIYLVPEQATYQAERAILSDDRICGYSRLHVLSFQRLCYMIFGKNLVARPLTSHGRDMIINRLLCENAEKLSVFSSVQNSATMATGLGNALCQFQQYSKSPDDVDNLIEQLKNSNTSQLTCSKLADINVIYKQYLDFIDGNFLNNDSYINLAKDAAAKSDFLKNCQLWVDGFAGFTTSELQLLGELIKVSSDCKIALCLEPSAIQNDVAPGPAEIFYPTYKTYSEILNFSRSLNIRINTPIFLEEAKRFEKLSSLAHIEKNVFSFKQTQKKRCDDNIKIVPCAKTRAEIDYVAREICYLVRQKNLRWRDIAVIAGDLDSYRHYTQAVFSDFGIPFFIDRRRGLSQYPAVELITVGLKIATEQFTTADIINYLKCDLVPISRGRADELENYCLAFNIEQADWLRKSKWTFADDNDKDFDNQQIELIRQQATGDLFAFRDWLQKQVFINSEQFAAEFFCLLEKLKVRETLQSWADEAIKGGRLDDAQTHQQFFSQFTQLVDDFLYIFKGSEFSVKQYCTIISSAISQMTVALVPPALDQVLVGSIERSRHPELKAVFLIGATQKQFPSPIRYDNILNDTDRKITADAGFELAASGASQLTERRYLAYIAFTRPSKYLYITYPMTDEKGSDVQPSLLIGQLRDLFDGLEEKKYFGMANDFGRIYKTSDLTELLASRLGKDNPESFNQLDAKCKWLLDSAFDKSTISSSLSQVKSAISYDNRAELDLEIADRLFGAELSTSPTKLKSFASCPYRHFAEHVLKLKERRVFELKPYSLGLFYHKGLEIIFHDLKKDNLTFTNLNQESVDKYVDTAVEKMLGEDIFLKSFTQKAMHNKFIILSAADILKSAVKEFCQIAAAGCFTQAASEIGFGNNSQLDTVKIDLDSKCQLRIEGKIDRVDVAAIGGENYAMVFDYKTSSMPVDFSMIAAGLDLQLLIYLLAIKSKTVSGFSDLQPLGGFYAPIQVGTKKQAEKISRKPRGFFNSKYFNLIDSKIGTGYSRFYPVQINKDGKIGRYEYSSLLTDAHYKKLLKFAKSKLAELGERIIAGQIEIEPYRYNKKTPCSYCPYKSLCRFDWQINGYNDIVKINKTDFFESV